MKAKQAATKRPRKRLSRHQKLAKEARPIAARFVEQIAGLPKPLRYAEIRIAFDAIEVDAECPMQVLLFCMLNELTACIPDPSNN